MRDVIACPICGERRRKLLYPATARVDAVGPTKNPYSGHYQINICGGCELVFSSPTMNAQDVEALYAGYRETNVAENEIENVRETMKGYYALAAQYIQSKDHVLDIGCDIGLLLQIAHADGFAKLFGIEPVDAAREQAMQRLPAAIISKKMYEHTNFENDTFDMIALIHVVDHLIEPDMVLDRVLGHLKPGGVCLAVVHDVQSPLACLTGERFPVFNYLHHFFFSKRTLRRLFETRGFDVLCVEPTRNVYSIAFFAERVPLLPAGLHTTIARMLRWLRLGDVPLSLPLGNIGIVARKADRSTRANRP